MINTTKTGSRIKVLFGDVDTYCSFDEARRQEKVCLYQLYNDNGNVLYAPNNLTGTYLDDHCSDPCISGVLGMMVVLMRSLAQKIQIQLFESEKKNAGYICYERHIDFSLYSCKPSLEQVMRINDFLKENSA